MAEPTITTTSSAVTLSAFSAFVLQATGLDLPPIIWSCIGAAFMLAYNREPVGCWRAIAQTVLSGLLGSLIGLGAAQMIALEQRHIVLLLCALGGFGAYPLMQRLLAFLQRKVDAQ